MISGSLVLAGQPTPKLIYPSSSLWLTAIMARLQRASRPTEGPAYHAGVDPVGVLARTPLFDGFPADELETLAPALKLRAFPKGSYLFHEGDAGALLFVVQAGQVKIARMGRTGEEAVYAVLLPGDVFGELALFDPNSVRTADAQAVEPTECVTLGREAFLAFLDAHPKLIRNL